MTGIEWVVFGALLVLTALCALLQLSIYQLRKEVGEIWALLNTEREARRKEAERGIDQMRDAIDRWFKDVDAGGDE